MSKTKEGPTSKIDAIMDKASKALVDRAYFECERLCMEAMEAAHAAEDYESMARICLPLQEARRQKRDLATDARRIFVVDDQLPKPNKLMPGCYLVRPPRVGLDGRMLKEMADRRDVPIIVMVREPTTRTGRWPVVALGPVTIRTLMDPPAAKPGKKRTRSKAAASNGGAGHESALGVAVVEDILPPVEWFLAACEALGDAALATVDAGRSPAARVEELLLRLQAHPDHEKLHQALAAVCMEAVRSGSKKVRRSELDELLEAEGLEEEDHHETLD